MNHSFPTRRSSDLGVSHAQIAQLGGFGKMRSSFDFAPYRRSAIGFDRLFDLLETDQRGDGSEGYPPFDLSRQGEDSYRITLAVRSEEHTSELQSQMRISYAVFCLKKKKYKN